MTRSRRGFPAVAFLVLLAPVFAGCVANVGDLESGSVAGDVATGLPDTSRGWSSPLTPAIHGMLPPVKLFLAGADGVEISIGVFLPDVAGCEWSLPTGPVAPGDRSAVIARVTAANATAATGDCRFPTVMDAGPYYGASVDVDKLRPPTIEWLVPRGYAVVQMSIRGTGESGGCMEFKSLNEARDVDATITWIAEQSWSNGNVGMIGRSYDGTTAWEGAALGNPALKTIVPISGGVNAAHLYFKNGTSEVRGPIQHVVTYWGLYGLSPGSPERQDHTTAQLCQETADGAVNGPRSTVTGDASSAYWQARDLRPMILEEYQGSVWIIQGLEDWNVNPSNTVPFIRDLQDAGIETRAWLGVWGHAYPDRVDEHRNVRWDWAQEVLEWFDHYLRDTGPAPDLTVQVEDNLFVWRTEESYPPRDAVFTEFALHGRDGLVPGEEGGSATMAIPDPVPAGFTSQPFDEAVRIAGLPQFHASVLVSSAAGGWLFAELHDVFPDGRSMRIGWATIDLRHHAGGNTNPATLVPGQAVTALMEFEPVDALISEGHRLRLVIHREGVEDVPASPDRAPVAIDLGSDATRLRLPVVDRPTIVPAYDAARYADA